MSNLDEIVRKYAKLGAEHHDTMAGYYSYVGFLANFLAEVETLSNEQATQPVTTESILIGSMTNRRITYKVTLNKLTGRYTCSCADAQIRGNENCKHVIEARARGLY